MKITDSFNKYLGSYNFERRTWDNGDYVKIGYVRTQRGVVGVDQYKQTSRTGKVIYHTHLNFGFHRRWIEGSKGYTDRAIVTLARRFAEEKGKP